MMFQSIMIHSFRPLQPFTTITTIRSKHSSTQTKRLFNQHPARLRLLKRLETKETTTTTTTTTPTTTPWKTPSLQYAPTFHTPHFLPNGWSAPPPPAAETIPTYPFRVARTRNKPNDAVGFLPVYTKHRKDGTKITTRIKQVSGDRNVFLQELQTLLPSTAIRVRTGGTIEMNGNVARVVRQWLAGLGF